MTKRFGELLKKKRVENNLRQLDLADMIGVAVNTIARIERDEQEPSWPTVCLLATALGVQTDYFRGTKNEKRTTKND